MFKKGDILIATEKGRRKGRHPIVFWDDNSRGNCEYDFMGIMLTHSPYDGENIKFKNRFLKSKEDRNISREHFIVPRILIKPSNWGPFSQIGELTEEGIEFIESCKLHIQKPISFDEYINLGKQQL